MSAPAARIAPALLGMALFLAAEAMFFGGLLSSQVFLIVASGGAWPHGHTVLPVASNGLTLSIAMAAACAHAEAWRAARRGAGYGAWLKVCAGCCALAVAGAAVQIGLMMSSGRAPAGHNLYALFVLVQALMALHLIGAAGWALAYGRAPADPARIEPLGWALHFLVLVQMVFFVTFFLL